MDRLWAPWRIKYIAGKKRKGCIFCKAVKARKGEYVVFKTKYAVCMLNIFPYNNGHLMVAPIRHIKELSALNTLEVLDLFKAITKAMRLLNKIIKPQGYNLGVNLSRTAGAGITGHLHVHIVPRWLGDTNFMPIIHQTKVISQSLDELCRRLRDADSKTD